MGIGSWLLLGLLSGLLGRAVAGDQGLGCGCGGLVMTVAVGLAGAAIGGFIGTQLGWGGVNDFDLRSFGLAFLGSVLVLLVLSSVAKGRERRR